MAKLIIETIEEVGGLIIESTNGTKKYYIEGPMIQTEVENRNGRKYSRHAMEEEVERYTKDKILTKRAIGELGHPPTPALNHERASHLIESLTQHGNDWIGKAKVLGELPMGKIVRGLIDEGVNFGVSTRGIGALKKVGNTTLVENYKLATAADVVADPSAPDAWVHGIMEGVDWIYNSIDDNYQAQKFAEQVKEEVHNKWKTFDETKTLRLFEAFLAKI